MSSQPEAPKPAVAPNGTKTDPLQAVIFICASVAVFIIFCTAMCFTLWFCWRKSRREYEAYRQRRGLARDENGKLDTSVKRQVRLPVVIINPDDDVEYGRKESSYFPERPGQEDKSCSGEPELPHTPPAGSYYIEGTPGFFEVDLEINDPQGKSDVKTEPRR